ncbi:hypothetical protein AcV5_005761 [Taiwanofungus camphoratus]|nr:hypothetical protein AcV5_005761 [Antrodia cinnamomea]
MGQTLNGGSQNTQLTHQNVGHVSKCVIPEDGAPTCSFGVVKTPLFRPPLPSDPIYRILPAQHHHHPIQLLGHSEHIGRAAPCVVVELGTVHRARGALSASRRVRPTAHLCTPRERVLCTQEPCAPACVLLT